MSNAPKIKTLDNGVRIREKDVELQARIGNANLRNLINEKRVKEAEKHMKELEADFPDEAKAEIAAIQVIVKTFKVPIDKTTESYEEYNDRVLNLKSLSGMFGFPLATTVAHSLFNFCHASNLDGEKDLEIIRIHVAMLARIFADNIRDDGGNMGREVVKQLRLLTGAK